MRIEVMLIAKESTADTTSVSTMIDLDTRKPDWRDGLVQVVADHAVAGAERLREHIATDEVPAAFIPVAVERPAAGFTPLAELVPSAAPGRHHDA